MRELTGRFDGKTLCLLCSLLFSLIQPWAKAQGIPFPALGSQVTSRVLKAQSPGQQCLTDLDHHDPCASVKIRGLVFTIAWDRETKAITYLFTKDLRFWTDSELSVGGICRVVAQDGKPYEGVHYMSWLVTPMWADTYRELSGEAVWYAVLRATASPEDETIAGFVQSKYLRIEP